MGFQTAGRRQRPGAKIETASDIFLKSREDIRQAQWVGRGFSAKLRTRFLSDIYRRNNRQIVKGMHRWQFPGRGSWRWRGNCYDVATMKSFRCLAAAGFVSEAVVFGR
jgi:hypothetical protein